MTVGCYSVYYYWVLEHLNSGKRSFSMLKRKAGSSYPALIRSDVCNGGRSHVPPSEAPVLKRLASCNVLHNAILFLVLKAIPKGGKELIPKPQTTIRKCIQMYIVTLLRGEGSIAVYTGLSVHSLCISHFTGMHVTCPDTSASSY